MSHTPEPGYYDLSTPTYMPWIGERTIGAHAHFFQGVRNPIGIKVGPTAIPNDIVALIQHLSLKPDSPFH